MKLDLLYRLALVLLTCSGLLARAAAEPSTTRQRKLTNKKMKRSSQAVPAPTLAPTQAPTNCVNRRLRRAGDATATGPGGPEVIDSAAKGEIHQRNLFVNCA